MVGKCQHCVEVLSHFRCKTFLNPCCNLHSALVTFEYTLLSDWLIQYMKVIGINKTVQLTILRSSQALLFNYFNENISKCSVSIILQSIYHSMLPSMHQPNNSPYSTLKVRKTLK